jgi:hypothetical protein
MHEREIRHAWQPVARVEFPRIYLWPLISFCRRKRFGSVFDRTTGCLIFEIWDLCKEWRVLYS